MYVLRFARRFGQDTVLGYVCSSFACIALSCVFAHLSFSQSGGSTGGALRIDRSVQPTPINQPPDVVTQTRQRKSQAARQNFDAANALRQREIAEETMKVLILARDLKRQIDKLGNDPLPEELIREVEVIEVFARDVQKKMTLAVGPG